MKDADLERELRSDLASIVLIVIALWACALPASRAAKIYSIQALRAG
jgi:ABC-type antimicrobial peptide transport system permease subunit